MISNLVIRLMHNIISRCIIKDMRECDININCIDVASGEVSSEAAVGVATRLSDEDEWGGGRG